MSQEESTNTEMSSLSPQNSSNPKKGKSHHHVEWADDHVNILVEWADKALCYRWLHSKSHAEYSVSNARYTIPVIIMSTLAGTANFAQDKFPESIKQYAVMGIGAINLFSGILTTIQQYLKISELNEAHRVASIAWDKFYRNTKVELAKAPEERISVVQMIKHAKEEYDRLIETSPIISEDVIRQFTETFSKKDSELFGEEDIRRQKAFLTLKKPEICNELESTRISVYKASAQAPKNNELRIKHKKIQNVLNQFNENMQRKPTIEEILSELEYKIDIDTIKSYMNGLEHHAIDIGESH
jgi:hypothetical protein